MAPLYVLHPENPQQRRIQTLVRELQRGAVILYPTDTVYAIGCDLQAKTAVQRLRQIKQLSNDKPLTFLCLSLSQAAQYAQIDDARYHWLRSLIPGPYTLLLPATKRVPAWSTPSKSRMVGVRIPQHRLCQALIAGLGNPLLSTSAHSPEAQSASQHNPNQNIPNQRNPSHKANQQGRDSLPPGDDDAVAEVDQFSHWEPLVDGILSISEEYPRILGAGASRGSDGGSDDSSDDGSAYLCSTILDLTEMPPKVVRRGLGMEAIAHWGLADAHGELTGKEGPPSKPGHYFQQLVGAS